ncbi:MAG TPA: class I SAM-dependent methyltransferase [Acidimicrobiales bacterium]|nr:class I SAM-dependent methyltransferase [Acidimicrobiales bacterium]
MDRTTEDRDTNDARPASRPTRRECPVCASRDAEDLCSLDLGLPDGHPLTNPFVVVSCAACGTGFTDDPVGQAAFDDYYATDAKYAEEGATTAGAAATADSYATPWSVANNRETADRLLSLLPLDASLLDLGCSVGALLVELQSRGMRRVIGLDPSPRSAEVAALLGADVRTGTFAEVPAGLGGLDAVTMIGVLEHLWDVPAAIASLVRLLRPGGLVYLDVPDAARYCHPLVVPFQDFNTEHTNHFSLRTLDLLFERHGFAPVWKDAVLTHTEAGLPMVPAAAGAWRWTGEARGRDREAPVERDLHLATELRRFARESAETLDRFDDHLEDALRGAAEVCVWGVGELAYKLLTRRAIAGRHLVALVDGNPARQGKPVAGTDVGEPSVLLSTTAPIVVAAGYAQRSIQRAAERLGVAERLVVLPFATG